VNAATGRAPATQFPSRAWWQQPATASGLALTLGLLVVALLAPWLAPGDPASLGPAADRLLAPSAGHPLGTDLLGRDVLARLVHGSRVSLMVGWLSVLISVLIGTAVGLAAGLAPHRIDRLLMGVTDVFLAFPRIFLILLLVSLTSPSLWLAMIVLGLTGWMRVARLVRAETLSIRERDYVAAARGLGLGSWTVALIHVLPNLMPVVLVTATLRVGSAILTESFLSFLGLGAQEPMVSWGMMIQHGRGHLLEGWWLSTFPGLAIAVTVVGYNLLGDGLRRHLDPRSNREGRLS
jgi:peptide/nickel transport system permease protein